MQHLSMAPIKKAERMVKIRLSRSASERELHGTSSSGDSVDHEPPKLVEGHKPGPRGQSVGATLNPCTTPLFLALCMPRGAPSRHVAAAHASARMHDISIFSNSSLPCRRPRSLIEEKRLPA